MAVSTNLRNARIHCVALAIFVLSAITLWDAPAGATSSCTFQGSTVLVTLDAPGDITYISRSFDGNIQVNRVDCTAPNGTGATVNNVDAIQVTDHTSTGTTLIIDLRYGGLRPGLTSEPLGESEVETSVDFGSNFSSDNIRIMGTVPDSTGNGEDVITFGALGAAFTTDDDADITFTRVVEVLGLGLAGDDILSAGGGNGTGAAYADSQSYMVGDTGDDTLVGGAWIDHLEGWSGNDALYGGDGNDGLNGGEGADLLDGQDGSADDTSYHNASSGGVTVDLSTGSASGGEAQGDTLANIEGVSGTDFDDVITGNDVANRLFGRRGNDVINGKGGDDTLEGFWGTNTLSGGAGDDYFWQGFDANGRDDISGGVGAFDRVDYSNRTGPVTVTPDDDANDGEPGEGDNVHSDVEEVDYPPPDDEGGTPPPSPTPGSSHSATSPPPSATPTASPTSSATPTPSPTPSSSPSPTKSPSPPPPDQGDDRDTCPGFSKRDGNNVVGTRRNDRLEGTHGRDIMCGLGGDDRIIALGGNDIVIGGAGDDVIDAGGGRDRVEGGASSDRGEDQEEIEGGAGDDVLDGGGGDDILRGNDGRDELSGGGDEDTLVGGAGSDRITSGEGSSNFLSGGGGADVLTGGGGGDTFEGDSGDDVLSGHGGPDYMLGGADDDEISGGGGRDQLNGMSGFDRCDGGGDGDEVLACEA